jgi:hypothetical protein
MPPAVADPALAPEGRVRIAWADRQMPVLRSARERLAVERALGGQALADLAQDGHLPVGPGDADPPLGGEGRVRDRRGHQ